MLLNLRAMPHGLESHREFLRTEVEAWLTGAAEETDVTFICTGVDTEERSQAVRLAARRRPGARRVQSRGASTTGNGESTCRE